MDNSKQMNRKDKYEDVASRFWNNVGFLLKKKKMTWKELAEELGNDPRTLSTRKITNCNPSVGNALAIANILGVSVDYLIYRDLNKEDSIDR